MPASAFLRFDQPPELDEGRETDGAGLRRPTPRWQPVAPSGARRIHNAAHGRRSGRPRASLIWDAWR
jgi:hypothetical protein